MTLSSTGDESGLEIICLQVLESIGYTSTPTGCSRTSIGPCSTLTYLQKQGDPNLEMAELYIQ
jgi:hypothetical protein